MPIMGTEFGLGSSSALILIWWYLDLRSNLENTIAPCNSSKSSSMVGIGKRFGIVSLLRAL